MIRKMGDYPKPYTQVTELFQILLIHVLMGEYKLFKVAVNPYYFATLKLFKSGNKYK